MKRRARGAFGLKDIVSDVEGRQLHPKPFVEGKHLEGRWLPTDTNKWLGVGNGTGTCIYLDLERFLELFEVRGKININ